VLLHIANALLLFLVFDRMTGMVYRSAAVAVLFALHPLHVESVAWVAERKDVLSTTFWMLTLTAYSYYVQRPSVGRYLLVVLSLTLGLMAKPMLVTLPCVLLLLDVWPLQRSRSTPARATTRLLLEKMPLFLLVAASCVMTSVAQRQALTTFAQYPLSVRVCNALLAYVGYLGKTFWPVGLAVYYPHSGATISVGEAVVAGVLLALITTLVLGLGRRWPYLAVGWLWYLGTLVPVIGLVQVGEQAMADRYSYVPLIGVFVLLVWGAGDLAAASRIPRALSATATAAVLCACGALTWLQLGYWSAAVTLWDHTLAVTENNAVAHINLGAAYLLLDMKLAAKPHFEKAIAIEPGNARAHYDLGQVCWDLHQYDTAATEFRRAAELAPEIAGFHYNLATALAQLGKEAEAEAAYRRALALDPSWAEAHRYLGLLLQAEGRLEEACAEFGKAANLGDRAASPLRLRCERYLTMRPRLPALVRGDERLAEGEAIEFAWLCQEPFERRYALAARFFAAAFSAQPGLADTRQPRFRYAAARAACRAACGQGADAATLNEQDRSRLRSQALNWLQADLAWSLRELTAARQPRQVLDVLQVLQLWPKDSALEGVREPQALAQLPQQEGEDWQKLWRETQNVLELAHRMHSAADQYGKYTE
jgi:Flp pilus assembly protein TadD